MDAEPEKRCGFIWKHHQAQMPSGAEWEPGSNAASSPGHTKKKIPLPEDWRSLRLIYTQTRLGYWKERISKPQKRNESSFRCRNSCWVCLFSFFQRNKTWEQAEDIKGRFDVRCNFHFRINTFPHQVRFLNTSSAEGRPSILAAANQITKHTDWLQRLLVNPTAISRKQSYLRLKFMKRSAVTSSRLRSSAVLYDPAGS